jgi:S1-C subfamily serine protease
MSDMLRLPVRRRSWILWVLVVGLPIPVAAGERPGGLDLLRATVQVRNGERRGSGTVIASNPGATWILTAAHVVKKAPGLIVELHRHNFGVSAAMLTEGGGWPRLVKAKVVAADTPGDVALVRVEGLDPLPYVARFDRAGGPPTPGEMLTSVGIDRGLHLTQWQTTVQGTRPIDIGQGGGPSPFTVTTRFPEHGRSGGGLYRADGTIVGVCTGQMILGTGQPKVGVFASYERIRRLLEAEGLSTGPRNEGLEIKD